MSNLSIQNLTTLLLAEKEEKRQLYNRYKDLERSRDHFASSAMNADNLRDQIRVLQDENKQLDKALGIAVDKLTA
ncbi:hypothetical protein NKH33_09630 [Mesorhizobium sp. M1182]|uniref:hypothetical protein n=1 Tax=Mesorhizobium sp. M1182 TaxID=2957067 RepID=UPI003334C632